MAGRASRSLVDCFSFAQLPPVSSPCSNLTAAPFSPLRAQEQKAIVPQVLSMVVAAGSEGWGVVESWKVVEDLVAAAPMWSSVDFGQGSLVCGGQAWRVGQ